MRLLGPVTAATALAAIAIPASLVPTWRPPPATAQAGALPKSKGEPSATQIAHWRELADDSCRCARAGGQSAECWATYDRETAAYEKGNAATMCLPVPHSWDCFGGDSLDMDKCVETDRDHAGPLLCSAAERRAMEAAWNREMNAIRDKTDAALKRAFARAGEATERLYQRMLRGEPIAAGGKAGCGG